VKNSVGFLIAAFHENRDAAQVSPPQYEKIDDMRKSTKVCEPRDDPG